MSDRGWILTILFSALALFTWWLSQSKPQAEPVPEFSGIREVDYYLRDLKVTTMDQQGRPARTLIANELKHFPDDDTIELLVPHMTIYQGDEPPWLVDADQGWVSSDGSLVLLSGAVAVDRKAGPNTRSVRLITTNMRIQPKEDYAETDEKVTVTSSKSRLDAVGMQAWLRKPSRFKFLSEVKGYYVPN